MTRVNKRIIAWSQGTNQVVKSHIALRTRKTEMKKEMDFGSFQHRDRLLVSELIRTLCLLRITLWK
jgi:hypothetical protein